MHVLENIVQEIEKRMKHIKNIPESEDNDEELDAEQCYEDGRLQGRYEELVRCREIIKNHMEDDGWIPCSERLPDEPEENPNFENLKLELYLVDDGSEYPFRAFWNGECFTDGFIKLKAIAWQPLPTKYKENK